MYKNKMEFKRTFLDQKIDILDLDSNTIAVQKRIILEQKRLKREI